MRILKITVFFACFLFIAVSFASANERYGEVTIEFDLQAPKDARLVRLWVPYAASDENQDIEDVKVEGNFSTSRVLREGRHGNIALYVEWSGAFDKRVLRYNFIVRRRVLSMKDFPEKELPFSKGEFKKYLLPTRLGPITGVVRETAWKITEGKSSNVEKGRAIYEWIINNMKRDPDVKGCGIGDVERLLASMGGKCGDIHSVFVSLSKSVGVPAREVFGIRLPKGKQGDITKNQHCWAEFYAGGYGWVPVDPSDVAKIMFEKKAHTAEGIKSVIEYYFGSVDENRIAFGTGRDIVLNPEQKGEPLNYFMYPYAEVDGAVLNEDLFGFNIGYRISFKEL